MLLKVGTAIKRMHLNQVRPLLEADNRDQVVPGDWTPPLFPVEMGVLQPDVYCLLQQQLLVGPGMVNHRGPLPLDWVVVLPCMLCKGRLLQCPLLACIPVLLHPCLEPPHCLPNVLLATAAGDLVYHLGPLLHHQGVLHPG